MTKDEIAGFVLTPGTAEQYFSRCMEAEKLMGPLSREERIVILKSLGTPVTLEELLDTMKDKKTLVIKGKDNGQESKEP